MALGGFKELGGFCVLMFLRKLLCGFCMAM